jgi:hypothetical protein
MQLIEWLMIELEPKLRTDWRSTSINYNRLLKYFHDLPSWFSRTGEKISSWRILDM